MAKKILIVDDDPDIVSYLEDVFTDAGYEAVSARNGRQALEALARERPDCVTLDLEMPDMTGPKFKRALDKAGQNLPIIVITGHPGLKYVIPGARAVFDKPIDRAALLAALRDILGDETP
jgi:two-component system, cell cycle response regulator DivK